MEDFLVFVVGVTIGFVLFFLLKSVRTKPPQTSGDLIIDNSDPYDGPYMMLNLTPEYLHKIPEQEFVYLKVRLENFSSQK